jgi:hypothetical protein
MHELAKNVHFGLRVLFMKMRATLDAPDDLFSFQNGEGLRLPLVQIKRER